jgi:hypothetical protein
MKHLTIIIIQLAMIIACTNDKLETKKQERITAEPHIAKAPDQKATGVYVDSILISHSVTHKFSDPIKEDSFVLVVNGQSLLDGQVTFKIISHNGTLLHTENFPTNYLIGYGLVGIKNTTSKQQEEYITKRIKDFFKEENFSYNPLKDDTFDKEYSNKEIWDDIKSDSTAIGFYYLIGEEDGRRIAFSKKKKTTELYYNCC